MQHAQLFVKTFDYFDLILSTLDWLAGHLPSVLLESYTALGNFMLRLN